MKQSTPHPALRPEGFRPLLGNEAARDRRLVSTLLDQWEKEGFIQVAPINVDFSDTLLTDHGEKAQARTFRFMDPSSGTMLALLSDVTHGITRLAKGELANAPRPLRLSYEGQAIRASGSATRPTRQFGQVGVEVIGYKDTTSTPFDLISLAIRSLETLGLKNLNITLVDPPLATALIQQDLPNLSDQEKHDLAQALDRKDEGKITALAGPQAARFIALMQGNGSNDPILQTLSHLKQQLQSAFTNQKIQVSIEPFEQRGFAFQAGPSFAIYSPLFSGELGRGGTYDLAGDRCFGFTLYRDAVLAA